MPRSTSPHAYTRTVLSPRIADLRAKPSGAAGLDVGRALRAARLAAGLSQDKLAARTADVARAWQTGRARRRRVPARGISQRTVSALELGQRSPSIRTARLMIDALELGRRDPLRRALLAAVSPSKRASRRLRGTVRRSKLLRYGVRALGGAVHIPTAKIQAAEARRLRQLGRRHKKGGMPKRRARRGRW